MEAKKRLLYGERFLPMMVPKQFLQEGAYYIGRCRNANIARWDGKVFHHWREKFGHQFVEMIKHPDDDEVFDVFVPIARANEFEVRPIDFQK